MTQTAKLTASDGAAGDNLGWSVAIAGDTIVVGAANDDISFGNQGSAYVFRRPPTGWMSMTQTAKLTHSDPAPSDTFGWAVSISSETVAVGAPGVNFGASGSQGAVYVFVKPPAGWVNMSQTAKLFASDGAREDNLGYSVSIDGGAIVAGAPQLLLGRGSAYVFQRPPAGWANATQTAKLGASDGANADFLGFSVGSSGDVVIVGGRGFGPRGISGRAYLYLRPAGGWTNTLENQKLLATDTAVDDEYGFSIGVSGDAVVVGATLDDVGPNVNQGSAYVFAPSTISATASPPSTPTGSITPVPSTTPTPIAGRALPQRGLLPQAAPPNFGAALAAVLGTGNQGYSEFQPAGVAALSPQVPFSPTQAVRPPSTGDGALASERLLMAREIRFALTRRDGGLPLPCSTSKCGSRR
jgi:hypothetical protein